MVDSLLIVTKQSVQAQHEYHIIIWLQKLQRLSSCMSQIITSQSGLQVLENCEEGKIRT